MSSTEKKNILEFDKEQNTKSLDANEA